MSGTSKTATTRVVVFAYHDIGVRCIEALLELGLEIGLVVTHRDDAAEHIWFQSVERVARRNGIPAITPDNPNTPELIRRVADCRPDFLFSFYYRAMLGEALLRVPARGAFNLHGSLLPKYRGRVPVNWAILHGETETGVSLHRMVAKPDAGAIVARQAVPILLNDTAVDVFGKLVCAAEQVVLRAVPDLVDGSARETPQDLRQGGYFGGRRPEDGRIDWSRPAHEIHNLVRAVAPPYPGAFFDAGAERVHVLGSYFRDLPARSGTPGIYWREGSAWADCADGRRLMITAMRIGETVLDETAFTRRFGDFLPLPPDAIRKG